MRARLSTLLASWILYWLLIIGIKAGPAIAAILRATSGKGAPEGSSSVNLSFGDAGFTLDVTRLGETLYHGAIGLLPLALWIALPPLVLYVIWAAMRRREVIAGAASATASHTTPDRR
jgi:hypothetical protein